MTLETQSKRVKKKAKKTTKKKKEEEKGNNINYSADYNADKQQQRISGKENGKGKEVKGLQRQTHTNVKKLQHHGFVFSAKRSLRTEV